MFLVKKVQIFDLLCSVLDNFGILSEFPASTTQFSEFSTILTIFHRFQRIFWALFDPLLATLWQQFKKCLLPKGNP